MDLEIARVTREMYKAFSGLNEGFQDVRRTAKQDNITRRVSIAQPPKDQMT